MNYGVLCRRSFSSSQSKFLEGLQKRKSLALTTWFCSPELGMKEYEVLMRSSAFIVKSTLQQGPAYHVVTSSHNLAPWRFPKYYPEKFLEYVNEAHVHYTLEIRNPEGEAISSVDILPNSFHHADRDIGVAHFDKDESRALSIFRTLMFQKVDIESYKAAEQENIEFHGHEVSTDLTSDDVDTETGKDIRRSVPRTVGGMVFARSPHQTFCSTDGGELSQGMCGGPVIGHRGSICGMIEGVVPGDNPTRRLRGKAVIIDSPDLLQFIDNVERAMANGDECENVVYLQGGDIAYNTIGVEATARKDEMKDPFENVMRNI